MKLVFDNILCKGFVLCRGRMNSNELWSYSKEDSKKDGSSGQIVYVLEGDGITPYGKGSYKDNRLIDLREFYDKGYDYRSGENGSTWLCINPIPANKFFNAELLLENNDYFFEGDKNKEQTIICVKNKIIANNKNVNLFKYLRVLPEKIVKVNIPIGSEAVYLTREK